MRDKPLVWLEPGDPFPPLARAWGARSPAPGLLAAGSQLDNATLHAAYSQAIFPWFSPGQPILWWSTDPRMVLPVAAFRLHRSLRKTLARFRRDPRCQIRIDHDFGRVIDACAGATRSGQDGTWLVPEMRAAYRAWHAAGFVHSVEVWRGSALVGGLYCVAIGQAVFGESMFSHETDASKIALAALVALCRVHGVSHIDCQQNTRHLASLGASEVPREVFAAHVAHAIRQPAPPWRFDPLYWRALEPNDAP